MVLHWAPGPLPLGLACSAARAELGTALEHAAHSDPLPVESTHHAKPGPLPLSLQPRHQPLLLFRVLHTPHLYRLLRRCHRSLLPLLQLHRQRHLVLRPRLLRHLLYRDRDVRSSSQHSALDWWHPFHRFSARFARALTALHIGKITGQGWATVGDALLPSFHYPSLIINNNCPSP